MANDTIRDLPDEARARFEVLRQSADAGVAAAIEDLARSGSDRANNRVNALEFATQRNLPLPCLHRSANQRLYDLQSARSRSASCTMGRRNSVG